MTRGLAAAATDVVRLLTAAECAAQDRATIAAGTPGTALMERAGRGVVDAMERHFGSPLALRVAVLCGAGNNGGDGLVAARHLHARGARVTVGVCAPRDRIAPDASVMLEALEAAGVAPRFVETEAALTTLLAGGWDIAVDALLGTGACGTPRGLVGAACEALERLAAEPSPQGSRTRIVAVDLPTGVSADDGSAAEHAVRAELTVTFGSPRRGHYLWPGRGRRGELEVVDIGLLQQANGAGVELADPKSLAALLQRRDPRAHKGMAGRVVTIGGAAGLTGASVLAARGAARAGAGYVRVCAPAGVQDVIASHLVEAMTLAFADDEHRALAPSALEAIMAEAALADAAVLGPGLSRRPGALALARELAARIECPLVIDADALFALSPLTGTLRRGSAPRVLTPHVGEMARLTGETQEAIESRRIDVALEWSARWGCVVVLKGAPTVTASPDGHATVNPTGNPGMATAGMGDVLAGAIGALLGQGLAPHDAAAVAVHAHGSAGDLAARELGAIGIVAGDVAARLPRALQMLREAR